MKKELFTPGDTAEAVLADVERKYDILNGIINTSIRTGETTNYLLPHVLAKAYNRPSPYDLYDPIVVDVTRSGEDCGTKWEKVPVYQGYDGTLTLDKSKLPKCPADYYGPDCSVYCNKNAGCTQEMTTEELMSKMITFQDLECKKGNAEYCEYHEYNPNNRDALMLARKMNFNNQESSHQIALSERKKMHDERMLQMQTALRDAENNFAQLQRDYENEYSAIQSKINSLTTDLERENAALTELSKKVLGEINNDAELAGLIAQTKVYDARLQELLVLRNDLISKVSVDRAILDELLKGLKDAEEAALIAAQHAALIAAQQEAERVNALLASQKLAELAELEAERAARLAEAAKLEAARLAALKTDVAKVKPSFFMSIWMIIWEFILQIYNFFAGMFSPETTVSSEHMTAQEIYYNMPKNNCTFTPQYYYE